MRALGRFILYAMAIIGVLFILFIGWGTFTSVSPDAISQQVVDEPVVIRTNGGWLEVATVKHQRSFKAPELTPTLLGIEVPVCQSRSEMTFVAYFTYRTKLEPDWKIERRDNGWYVLAPELAPSLPIAYDTATVKRIREKCLWTNSQVQEDTLDRAITGELGKQAKSDVYLRLAHDAGRKTVEEFVRKWLRGNDRYSEIAELPISVQFRGERIS